MDAIADGIRSTCTHREFVSKEDLIKHLDQVHSVKPQFRSYKRPKAADDASKDGVIENKMPRDEKVKVKKSRTELTKSKIELRRVLEPTPINNHLLGLLKSSKSTATTLPETGVVQDHATPFVGDEE